MPARKGQKYKPRTKVPQFTGTVICVLCSQTFERTHSGNKYCVLCRRKAKLQQIREWHKENPQPEYWRDYRKQYYAENAAKINERTSAYSKTERGKEVRRTIDQNQKLHNAKKVAARQIVKMAIVGGRLEKQPCEKCGDFKVEAHHEDYDKPLEVIWLCVPDHKRLHRERTPEPQHGGDEKPKVQKSKKRARINV